MSSRRRYRVNSDNASSDDTGEQNSASSSWSLSLRSKRRPSGFSPRKRLSNLFSTISCGSGLDKDIVLVTGYRALGSNQPTDRVEVQVHEHTHSELSENNNVLCKQKDSRQDKEDKELFSGEKGDKKVSVWKANKMWPLFRADGVAASLWLSVWVYNCVWR